MRTNIEIDDRLMAEAQKVSGLATKKQTVEEALRLMVRLRRQREVDAAFGRYRWTGNLAQSRKGRGTR
ncbi:MAG: type II toxin-antitoxin system VapB family antitoxin [Reyranellales bacterium]|jgi:Arc/MetJ family transcription regulator